MIDKMAFFTAGCPRSQISGKNLEKAIKQLGLDIGFESIDDPNMHKEHGVSAFPAIKINNEIKTEGSFLSVADCKEILSQYIEE